MVNIDLTQPVMLIDTSYFIFYRYFAVYNWYKLAKQTVLDVPSLLTNSQFMGKFDKLFEDNMEKLRKAHNIQHTNVVFVKDCMRDHIWRFKHFAQYKKSREERLTTFNGDIFKYCYSTLLPRLEEKYHVQSCEHPHAEADDIVAVFTRLIHDVDESTKVVIVTNDNDYLQLINDNTTIINMKNHDLKERLTCPPATYLRKKIILGDKSDNIPAIFPKCGEKRALQLAQNDELLEEKLASSPDIRAKFELNTLLIDTTKIPDSIQTDIKDMLQLHV